MIEKIFNWLGFDKQKWKWRYLITTPLIGIIGAAAFIFCYTGLIILLMCIGGATP